MNKVQLTPLAICDLSLTYARKTAPNKLRHYRVSMISNLVGDPQGAQGRLVDFIKSEEGPETEVEFLPDVITQRNINTKGLHTELVSDVVLKGMPAVEKSLLKVAAKQQLLQHIEYSKLSQVLDKVEEAFYRLKDKVAGLVSGKQSLYPHQYRPHQKRRIHHITPVSYLAYSYRESEEQKAIELLRKDLQILQDHKLIMGHLALPTTIFLADQEGSGELTKAIFCFVFADIAKLAKKLGKKPIEMQRLPLHQIGIKSETLEGGLSDHLGKDKYEIEKVDVPMLEAVEARKSYLDNYEQNRVYVNEAAAKQRAALDEGKYEATSKHLDGRTIEVTVTKKSDS